MIPCCDNQKSNALRTNQFYSSELLSRIQVLHNNYKQIFVYCLIDKKRSDPSINDVNKEMIFQPVSLIECNSLKELINFVELLKVCLRIIN